MNTLKEGLHSLRAVCLRSFPEFLADIKMAGIPGGPGSELSSDVADITIRVRSAVMGRTAKFTD